MSLSHCGTYLTSCSHDQLVKFWNIEDAGKEKVSTKKKAKKGNKNKLLGKAAKDDFFAGFAQDGEKKESESEESSDESESGENSDESESAENLDESEVEESDNEKDENKSQKGNIDTNNLKRTHKGVERTSKNVQDSEDSEESESREQKKTRFDSKQMDREARSTETSSEDSDNGS